MRSARSTNPSGWISLFLSVTGLILTAYTVTQKLVSTGDELITLLVFAAIPSIVGVFAGLVSPKNGLGSLGLPVAIFTLLVWIYTVFHLIG